MPFSHKFVEVQPHLLVRKKMMGILPQIDGLVLDIDGVILDVSRSFRVAISKTTQYYFSKILNWEGASKLITPEETQLFKLAGGFNNDWELTYGVVLFYLGKSQKFSSQNLDFLRSEGESLEEFTEKVRDLGGGLKTLEKLIFSSLSQGQQRKVTELWRKDVIKRVFQEYYGGVDYCQRLYGFNPTLVKQKGLLNEERVLVDREKIKFFYPKVAVVTGRTGKETVVALERANLADLIPSHLVLSDDGGVLKKPNPEVLLSLGFKMQTRVGIYMGDTLDDLQTVRNFEKIRTQMRFLSCIISRKRSEAPIYIEGGVDVLARDPNGVLSFIIRSKEMREESGAN